MRLLQSQQRIDHGPTPKRQRRHYVSRHILCSVRFPAYGVRGSADAHGRICAGGHSAGTAGGCDAVLTAGAPNGLISGATPASRMDSGAKCTSAAASELTWPVVLGSHTPRPAPLPIQCGPDEKGDVWFVSPTGEASWTRPS